MQTIMTLEGSTNPAMKLRSLADPSRVSSSKIVDRSPRAVARGYYWSAPAGLGARPNVRPYLRHRALSYNESEIQGIRHREQG